MQTSNRLQAAGLLLLAIVSGSVQAQVAPALTPGTRIRVTDRFQTRVGTILSSGDSTIRYVGAHADTESIAVTGISRLELSTGIHHRVWHGAGIGALGGALVGAVLGASAYKMPNCNDTQSLSFCGIADPGQGGAAAAGAIVGAIGGGAIGALLGGVLRSETWQTIPVQSHGFRVTVAPARGGLAVQAHVAM